jgi:hypothetical protein
LTLELCKYFIHLKNSFPKRKGKEEKLKSENKLNRMNLTDISLVRHFLKYFARCYFGGGVVYLFIFVRK